MATQTNGGVRFASIALGVIGLLLLAVGGVLFFSHLTIAGYGIWILVWGLAVVTFLVLQAVGLWTAGGAQPSAPLGRSASP